MAAKLSLSLVLCIGHLGRWFISSYVLTRRPSAVHGLFQTDLEVAREDITKRVKLLIERERRGKTKVDRVVEIRSEFRILNSKVDEIQTISESGSKLNSILKIVWIRIENSAPTTSKLEPTLSHTSFRRLWYCTWSSSIIKWDFGNISRQFTVKGKEVSLQGMYSDIVEVDSDLKVLKSFFVSQQGSFLQILPVQEQKVAPLVPTKIQDLLNKF